MIYNAFGGTLNPTLLVNNRHMCVSVSGVAVLESSLHVTVLALGLDGLVHSSLWTRCWTRLTPTARLMCTHSHVA